MRRAEPPEQSRPTEAYMETRKRQDFQKKKRNFTKAGTELLLIMVSGQEVWEKEAGQNGFRKENMFERS